MREILMLRAFADAHHYCNHTKFEEFVNTPMRQRFMEIEAAVMMGRES